METELKGILMILLSNPFMYIGKETEAQNG